MAAPLIRIVGMIGKVWTTLYTTMNFPIASMTGPSMCAAVVVLGCVA